MNNVDWSIYDYDDKTPQVVKAPQKEKSYKKVDWDLYDPPAEKKEEGGFLESAKDFGKTIVKGAVEGISRLGTVMGPIRDNKPISKQLEEQTEVLDKYLP